MAFVILASDSVIPAKAGIQKYRPDRVALDSGLRRNDARGGLSCRRPYSMPSLDLSRSLTACGLALPWVAFITCPTNQPISAGFALACSTLPGLAALTSGHRRQPGQGRAGQGEARADRLVRGAGDEGDPRQGQPAGRQRPAQVQARHRIGSSTGKTTTRVIPA